MMMATFRNDTTLMRVYERLRKREYRRTWGVHSILILDERHVHETYLKAVRDTLDAVAGSVDRSHIE